VRDQSSSFSVSSLMRNSGFPATSRSTHICRCLSQFCRSLCRSTSGRGRASALMHDWIVFRELDHPSIKLDFGIVLLKLDFNKNDIPDVACLRALDKKHIRSPHAFKKRFEGESFSSDESSVLDETTGRPRTDLCLCFTLASHNIFFFVSLFPQIEVHLLLNFFRIFC